MTRASPQQALAIWTALVKAHPRNEDYLLQQAGAYSSREPDDKAISTLRAFLKRFPELGAGRDRIKEQITQLEEQAKPGSRRRGAGNLPISIG